MAQRDLQRCHVKRSTQHAARLVVPACPQGGTLGMWPKPYRNKTRQVMPNSVHEWKCSSEAANFTAATASSTPLLQSCEQGGGAWGAGRAAGCLCVKCIVPKQPCPPSRCTLPAWHTARTAACWAFFGLPQLSCLVDF